MEHHGSSFYGTRDCVPILKGIAIVSGALFTGISICIQRVGHPALSTLPTEFAVKEWRESYRRAAPIQVSLAAISSVASLLTFGSIMKSTCRVANKAIMQAAQDSVLHCSHYNGKGWLLSGVLMGLIIPYTLIVIFPTNQKLLSLNVDTSSDDARQLLSKWGELHAVRSILSASAVLIMACKIFNHSHASSLYIK